MSTPLVSLVGTILNGGPLLKGSPVQFVTPNGCVLNVPDNSIESAELIQAGEDEAKHMYRLLIIPNATLSMNMRADAWAEMDSALDHERGKSANSGAPKKIEDTA